MKTIALTTLLLLSVFATLSSAREEEPFQRILRAGHPSMEEIQTLKEAYHSNPNAFAASLRSELSAKVRDTLEGSRLLALTVRLHVVELSAELPGWITDPTVPSSIRIQAIRTLLELDPRQTGVPYLDDLVANLPALNTADREGALLLIDLQPLPRALATLQDASALVTRHIQSLENGGIESREVELLGEWGHLDSLLQRKALELKRAATVETAARKQGVAPLLDEFLTSWTDSARKARVLQTLRRLGLREAAIDQARVLGASADESKAIKLLDLRSQLADDLTFEEEQKLTPMRSMPD